MEQYIPKSALVAEIERRIESCAKQREDMLNVQCHTLADDVSARMGELNCIKDFLDTLEVKEDTLLIEKPIERELAEAYINVFDKKFGNKLPNLKGIQLHDFKNFINTCEQTFHMKYFDYHATQGKLFEKLALLWAVWGKEHLSTEMKKVDLEKELESWRHNHFHGRRDKEASGEYLERSSQLDLAKHFFELGLKARKI